MTVRSISRTAISILTLLALIVTVKCFYDYRLMRSAFYDDVKHHARAELESTQHFLQEKLQEIEAVGNQLAQALSEGSVKQDVLLKKLHDAALSSPLVIAVGVAYKPHAYEKNLRFARQYVRTDHKAQEVLIEKFYDYTSADWFKQGLTRKKGWTEPYFSSVLNKVVVNYSVAITHVDEKTKTTQSIGLIFIELTLHDLATIMGLPTLEYSQTAFLLSHKGEFLFYPNGTYAADRKTIFDISYEPGKHKLFEIGSRMIKNELGHSELYDSDVHKSYWIYYAPLGNGWSLGLMVEKVQSLAASGPLKRKIIQLCLALLLLIISLFLFSVRLDDLLRLWSIVGLVSLAIVATIIFMWYLELTRPRIIPHNTTVISNRADLQRFVRFQSKINAQLSKSAVSYIPTSLYVSSITLSKGNAELQGYIWQFYNQEVSGVTRGVRITNAFSSTLAPAYKKMTDDGELIGYRFTASIDTDFSYLKYPFDRQTIDIGISHIDFDSNVVLIPDFDSWDSNRIRLKLGLADTIKLSDWSIDGTYFSYVTSSLSTDFGIDSFVRKKEFPELEFNISLHRNIRDPLINGLLPIVIVFLFLFGSLLILNPLAIGEQATLGTILSGFISIFFSTILAQQKLQGTLASTGQISYFEFFYYISYAFLFLILVNALILKLTKRVVFIRAYNNLFAKIIYWPALLMSILALTISIFY